MPTDNAQPVMPTTISDIPTLPASDMNTTVMPQISAAQPLIMESTAPLPEMHMTPPNMPELATMPVMTETAVMTPAMPIQEMPTLEPVASIMPMQSLLPQNPPMQDMNILPNQPTPTIQSMYQPIPESVREPMTPLSQMPPLPPTNMSNSILPSSAPKKSNALLYTILALVIVLLLAAIAFAVYLLIFNKKDATSNTTSNITTMTTVTTTTSSAVGLKTIQDSTVTFYYPTGYSKTVAPSNASVDAYYTYYSGTNVLLFGKLTTSSSTYIDLLGNFTSSTCTTFANAAASSIKTGTVATNVKADTSGTDVSSCTYTITGYGGSNSVIIQKAILDKRVGTKGVYIDQALYSSASDSSEIDALRRSIDMTELN